MGGVLFELVGQALLEVVAYGTGKIFARVFLPNIGVEPFMRQRSMPPWKWRGLTYQRGDRKLLYTEAVVLLGLGVWLIGGVVVFSVVHWCSACTV